MNNEFYSIPHLFSWIPELTSLGWGTMAAQKSRQVTGRCALASNCMALLCNPNVPSWRSCRSVFSRWFHPFCWLGPRQLYILSKQMDNKVEIGSCTEIGLSHTLWLFPLPGNLPLPSCRRPMLRIHVLRVVDSLPNICFLFVSWLRFGFCWDKEYCLICFGKTPGLLP